MAPERWADGRIHDQDDLAVDQVIDDMGPGFVDLQ
jgi:hypothetical protein